MNIKQNRRRPMAEINVVPYIDVMLVLLVIFMITTPLLSQGVKVDLPQATAQALTAAKEPIVVSVDAQGNYYLNLTDNPGQPIDSITLSNKVSAQLRNDAQQGQTQQVLVKADEHVDYGKVMQAMVLLQQAGAASVGLVTDPPSKSE